jgi:hypothetical protein
MFDFVAVNATWCRHGLSVPSAHAIIIDGG